MRGKQKEIEQNAAYCIKLSKISCNRIFPVQPSQQQTHHFTPMAAEDPSASTETHASPIKAARQSGKTSSKVTGSASKTSEKLARWACAKTWILSCICLCDMYIETAIIPMHDAALRGGSTVQVEGVVTASDVQYRPRRQLVVTISDDSGQVVLRFLNFYGSQLKQLAMGVRVRARGELRHGFWGRKWCTPATKSSTKARHYQPR